MTLFNAIVSEFEKEVKQVNIMLELMVREQSCSPNVLSMW